MKRYARLLERLMVPLVISEVIRADAARRSPAGRRRLMSAIWRMYRTPRAVPTASHPLEHLTMLAALLRLDGQEGAVVECGAFKGGSTANLSLACRLTDRRLEVYDSFAGLPAPANGDGRHQLLDRPEMHAYVGGQFTGTLNEVRTNVEQRGDISRCVFWPGYFEESMRSFSTPCVLVFVDVDLRSSVETCLEAIWPHLADGGYVFVHEAPHLEIASLFFDDPWWQERLGCSAPGLVGAGSGIGLQPMQGFWRSALGFAVKNPDVSNYYVRPPVD